MHNPVQNQQCFKGTWCVHSQDRNAYQDERSFVAMKAENHQQNHTSRENYKLIFQLNQGLH